MNIALWISIGNAIEFCEEQLFLAYEIITELLTGTLIITKLVFTEITVNKYTKHEI